MSSLLRPLNKGLHGRSPLGLPTLPGPRQTCRVARPTQQADRTDTVTKQEEAVPVPRNDAKLHIDAKLTNAADTKGQALVPLPDVPLVEEMSRDDRAVGILMLGLLTAGVEGFWLVLLASYNTLARGASKFEANEAVTGTGLSAQEAAARNWAALQDLFKGSITSQTTLSHGQQNAQLPQGENRLSMTRQNLREWQALMDDILQQPKRQLAEEWREAEKVLREIKLPTIPAGVHSQGDGRSLFAGPQSVLGTLLASSEGAVREEANKDTTSLAAAVETEAECQDGIRAAEDWNTRVQDSYQRAAEKLSQQSIEDLQKQSPGPGALTHVGANDSMSSIGGQQQTARADLLSTEGNGQAAVSALPAEWGESSVGQRENPSIEALSQPGSRASDQQGNDAGLPHLSASSPEGVGSPEGVSAPAAPKEGSPESPLRHLQAFWKGGTMRSRPPEKVAYSPQLTAQLDPSASKAPPQGIASPAETTSAPSDAKRLQAAAPPESAGQYSPSLALNLTPEGSTTKPKGSTVKPFSRWFQSPTAPAPAAAGQYTPSLQLSLSPKEANTKPRGSPVPQWASWFNPLALPAPPAAGQYTPSFDLRLSPRGADAAPKGPSILNTAMNALMRPASVRESPAPGQHTPGLGTQQRDSKADSSLMGQKLGQGSSPWDQGREAMTNMVLGRSQNDPATKRRAAARMWGLDIEKLVKQAVGKPDTTQELATQSQPTKAETVSAVTAPVPIIDRSSAATESALPPSSPQGRSLTASQSFKDAAALQSTSAARSRQLPLSPSAPGSVRSTAPPAARTARRVSPLPPARTSNPGPQEASPPGAPAVPTPASSHVSYLSGSGLIGTLDLAKAGAQRGSSAAVKPPPPGSQALGYIRSSASQAAVPRTFRRGTTSQPPLTTRRGGSPGGPGGDGGRGGGDGGKGDGSGLPPPFSWVHIAFLAALNATGGLTAEVMGEKGKRRLPYILAVLVLLVGIYAADQRRRRRADARRLAAQRARNHSNPLGGLATDVLKDGRIEFANEKMTFSDEEELDKHAFWGRRKSP